jgi:hypothetical protein
MHAVKAALPKLKYGCPGSRRENFIPIRRTMQGKCLRCKRAEQVMTIKGNDYNGKIVRSRSYLGKAVIDRRQVLHELGLRIYVVPIEKQGSEV